MRFSFSKNLYVVDGFFQLDFLRKLCHIRPRIVIFASAQQVIRTSMFLLTSAGPVAALGSLLAEAAR